MKENAIHHDTNYKDLKCGVSKCCLRSVTTMFKMTPPKKIKLKLYKDRTIYSLYTWNIAIIHISFF